MFLAVIDDKCGGCGGESVLLTEILQYTALIIVLLLYSCDNQYLMLGSDCADQNLIIGITVGVGGVLLIGITAIITVVVVRRKAKYKYQRDGDSMS
jgi:hypothetical protein